MIRSSTKLPASHTTTPELNFAICEMSVTKRYCIDQRIRQWTPFMKEGTDADAVDDSAQALHEWDLIEISLDLNFLEA